MVRITVEDERALIEVLGWHKVLALKSRIEIPLTSIQRMVTGDAATRGFGFLLRMPGTHLPGVIIAGTYYGRSGRSFWDVRNRDCAIALWLEGERYASIVVEVEDPKGVARRLAAAKLHA